MLGALCAVAVAGGVQAQSDSKAALPAIYMYQGQDREKLLLDGARKEGTVTVYTSMNTKDSVPITAAFEKKYGIKVVLWRAGSEKIVQRSVTEARANRFTPDVIDTNGPEMEALAREELLSEFYSPAFKDIPKVAFPPHRRYVAERFNFFTIAYNTNLVKPEDVPNTYEDLLKPRWAGKVGIEAGDVDWFAALVKAMGEEKGLAYFRNLSEMDPQIRIGHTLMVELLAAGEMDLLAAAYNHNVERAAVGGAPVKWKALAPTFGRPNAVGLARHAPHPHAGLLFAEFLLSREGQKLIAARHRVPSSKAVNSPLAQFGYQMIDPGIVLDEAEKWDRLWEDIMIKGRGASMGQGG